MTYRLLADAADIRSRLDWGLAAHRAGEIEQALSAYRQVLMLAPDNAAALNLLGTGLLQVGETAQAVEYLERAARQQRSNPELLANLGQAYLNLQRYSDAAATYRRASRLDPRNVHFQLGAATAVARHGRFAEAETMLQRLATRFPKTPLVWFNLGNVLRDRRDFEGAIAAYRKALELDPTLVDALNNLGSVLHSTLRFAEAEAAYRQCIALAPDNLIARYNLASAVMDTGRFAESEGICREIIARAPDLAEGHSILGAAVGHQGRLIEALECHSKAAELAPSHPKQVETYASALVETGNAPQGLRWFSRALTLAPAADAPHQLLGTALLAHGCLQEGWNEYGRRPAALRFREKYAQLALTRELPEHLEGKHICVLREQGLGDEIFFLRYARVLAARGARVTYRSSEKLWSMLSRIGWISGLVGEVADLPPADAYILLGDLPHALGMLAQSALTELPLAESAPVIRDFGQHISVFWPEVPPTIVLEPLRERVAELRERLRALGPPPYVGVTWRAGTAPEEQTSANWVLYKNVPLLELAAAMRPVQGTLVALQRRPAAGEIDDFSTALGRAVHDLTDLNDDLEGMLALLALVDDYVTVSNTNVHLRAAVGRTARVLVPAPPEWRWRRSGRATPWFPGFPVYRQSLQGEWRPALRALEHDLK